MCWEADFPRIRLVTQDSDFLGLLWTVMPASLIVHCTHYDSFCPHFSLHSSAHYWLSPDLSVGQSSEDWPVCVLIIGGKQAVLSPFWQSVSGFPATSEPSAVDCVTSSYSDSFIKAVIWRGDREVQTQVPLKWQLSVGHPRSHLVSPCLCLLTQPGPVTEHSAASSFTFSLTNFLTAFLKRCYSFFLSFPFSLSCLSLSSFLFHKNNVVEWASEVTQARPRVCQCSAPNACLFLCGSLMRTGTVGLQFAHPDPKTTKT